MSKTIWDKVDAAVAESIRQKATDSRAAAAGAPADAQAQWWQKKKWKRDIRIADVVGSVVWIYSLIKVLAVDLDRIVLRLIAPQLEFIADFRFFALLLVLAIIVLAVRRAPLLFAYVALFPLVVLFWKVPRFFYRWRSWNLVLATINASQAIFRRFKLNFPIRVVEAVAAVIILTTNARGLLLAAIIYLLVALLFHYSRSIATAVRSSRFLRTQEAMVERVSEAMTTGKTYKISDGLRSDEIEKFDSSQLEQFANTVSSGILAIKGLGFYAGLLGKYRRSNAGIVIAGTSFAWLLTQSVLYLTLINYGLWKASPSDFTLSAAASGSFLEFLYFSVTALYGTVIPQIGATGPAALAIAVGTGLYGPILVVSLALQLLFGYRQSRDEQKFAETIARIRQVEKEVTSQLEHEYEMALDEALQRLRELGIGASVLLASSITRLPETGEEEEADKNDLPA